MNEEEKGVSNNEPQKVGESKAGIGVVCALFLGLIGLLIGYFIYKEKNLDYEWKTFLKGWLWTFIIVIIVSVILSIIAFAAGMSVANEAINQFYNY